MLWSGDVSAANVPVPVSLDPVEGKCNRTARSTGGLCRRPAGWGVKGVTSGPCRIHRGRPIKHGLYSKLVQRSDRVGELIREHAENPDPLDTKPELAIVRALLQDWIERYSEAMPALLAWYHDRDLGRPATVPDITECVRLIDSLSKAAKRERDTENANWISRKDLRRLLHEIMELVRLSGIPEAEPCPCCGAHYKAIRKGVGGLAVKS